MPILTPEERVGTTLAGKYRLDAILASGGMATVFAGMHGWTERTVAVKILNYEHARDPEIVRRFLQEARAAAQLKHPNVVDVLDMGQDTDGTVFLVLELLEGETLKARIRRGAIPLPELGPLLAPVMRAVASAHAKGVVHRDIKPDNVFLSIGPNGEVIPKLLDFGIAKVVSEGDSGSTRTGTMVGTPQFMAPEQVRGEREVGPRADVWSMGVLLHYAITKTMPFNAESATAVLARVLTERARPIREIAPGVPPGLAAVVDRALQHEAAARFADMREMVTAFEHALGSTSPAAEVSRMSSPGVISMVVAPPPRTAPLPIGATPTAIVPVAPLPAPAATGVPITHASEYPPSPTTPYAWGMAPPPVEVGASRRLGPMLAAAAAGLLLLGGATFFVVLGSGSDDAPTRPLGALGGASRAPDVATAAPPIPTAPTIPIAPAPSAAQLSIAPTPEPAAPPPPVVPQRVEPASSERAGTPAPARADAMEATPPSRPTTPSRRTRGVSRREEPEASTRASGEGTRGTGGALILHDDAPPPAIRRGTRGAPILR